MKRRLVLPALFLMSMSVLAVACAPDSPTGTESRAPIDAELLDTEASCSGKCGGPADVNHSCWCDPSCVQFGDCCGDFDLYCEMDAECVEDVAACDALTEEQCSVRGDCNWWGAPANRCVSNQVPACTDLGPGDCDSGERPDCEPRACSDACAHDPEYCEKCEVTVPPEYPGQQNGFVCAPKACSALDAATCAVRAETFGDCAVSGESCVDAEPANCLAVPLEACEARADCAVIGFSPCAGMPGGTACHHVLD